jgi:hypothetical protein
MINKKEWIEYKRIKVHFVCCVVSPYVYFGQHTIVRPCGTFSSVSTPCSVSSGSDPCVTVTCSCSRRSSTRDREHVWRFHVSSSNLLRRWPPLYQHQCRVSFVTIWVSNVAGLNGQHSALSEFWIFWGLYQTFQKAILASRVNANTKRTSICWGTCLCPSENYL